jgi:membrane protein
MAKLWSLKGLSWRELAKRTCRKSWDDEVFGQAARLAFYYFLSLFPVLLLLLILFDKLAGTGSDLRSTLLGAFQQILPRGAAALIAKTAVELNAGAVIGVGAVAAGLASAWGALNGTWAMMTGLNKAYEVNEERHWWKVLSIAFGLTIALGIMGLVALCAMLYGSRAGNMLDQDFGIRAQSLFLWRIIQWPVTAVLLLFSFALLYRFGPNLKDRRWQWSIPGAAIAATLWIGSALLFRVYENHFSSQRIYGGLNAAVTLLLWLYSTGAAIFIGGEANSEIEKAGAKAHRADVGGSAERRSGGEGNPND